MILELPVDDVDPEIADLLARMEAMQDAQHSISFTTLELAALSFALGHAKTMLTQAVRKAPEEAVESATSMLTDVSMLERRLDTTLKGIYRDTVGTDDLHGLLEKVSVERDKVAQKLGRGESRPEMAEAGTGLYL